MRLLVGGRPWGSRLRQPTTVKLKGLMVQRASDQPYNKSFWIDWRWTTHVKTQIDLAVAKGANCVRIPGCTAGVVQGLQTQSDFDSKLTQILDYTASTGLLVYWISHLSYGGDDLDASDPATLAAVTAMMAIVGNYSHVVGNDCSNESVWQVGSSRALANQQAFYPAIKAVAPNLPLSVSHLVTGSSAFTDPNLTQMANYVDFWDFHPYYGSGNAVDADLATFRASVNYKPFLIGECGSPLSAGSSTQAARWTAVGALGSVSDSYGAIGYAIQSDFAGDGDYGMFSADGTWDERAWISSAFAEWPARA